MQAAQQPLSLSKKRPLRLPEKQTEKHSKQAQE